MINRNRNISSSISSYFLNTSKYIRRKLFKEKRIKNKKVSQLLYKPNKIDNK